MPLYSYVCDACGPFEDWGVMSEADKPSCCPACAADARRDLAMPNLGVLDGKLRKALDRTDRTASEPKVVSRQHLANCGCSLCATRKKKPTPIERRWSLGH